MKKIFTFCAAVLASVSLAWAQTTIFSAQAIVTSDVSIAKGMTDQEVTAEQATITGGSMYVTNGETSDKKLIVKSVGPSDDKKTAFSITNSKTWFKVVLSQALAEGDVISANVYAGSDKDGEEGLWFSVDAARPGAAPAIKADGATAGSWSDVSYTVAANDDLNGKTTFYIHRATGTTTSFVDFTIVRPVQKEVDHVDVTLGGVAVNGEALGELDMATLYGALTLNLAAEYVEAPTVTFTVQTDTYYVGGEGTPSTKSEKIDVVAALNPDGKWQAQYTVSEKTYTITAVKPATATITYMDGATVLGEETVKVGEPATKYADYQEKPLAEFQGWYTDAELTAAADLTAAINANLTLYGKFMKTYISANLNIEQLVLDYGTNYDIKTALTAAGWGFENLNSLDSLNDLEKKDNRNYAFLGLKLKTAGAYIQGWIPADGGVVIKFGNLGSDIKVTITGANTNLEQTFTAADLAEMDNEFPIYGYTEEVLVKISTVTGSTVVLKQLMLLNEGIQEVTLPAPGAYAITLSAENGTLEAAWEGKTDKKVNVPVGATVTLTATPAEGYKLETITVNEVALEAVEGVYSFTMPAQAANVVATFVAESGTGITNTEAAVKAVKVVREGKLFIEKGGVLYNAQGVVVR